MRYDPLRYFYRFFAFVLFRRIFVSFKMVNDYEQVLPEDWDAFLQEDAALDYVRQIVNCFDESALELALRIKDYYSQIGEETELTALTIANDSPSFFKTLFATGYDRVIRLTPSPGENFSPLSIADKILSFIREEQAGFDAFLFGQQAAPFDSGQVPYFVAQGLGIPAISNIISLKAETDSLVAVSQKSDHILTYRISSPAVCLIGNCKRTYLRVPTLREKLAVSKKEALCHTFSVEEQPSYQPEHLVRNMSERSPVLYHNLEPQEAADQILNILKEEVSR